MSVIKMSKLYPIFIKMSVYIVANLDCIKSNFKYSLQYVQFYFF